VKWLRVIGAILAGAFAVLIVANALTARSADPMLWPPVSGAPTVEIHLVSHGYHSGLVLPRAAMEELASERGNVAPIAVAQRFNSYRWLEIGWGDEGFYRSVPDVTSLTVRFALRALFLPGNASVVQVVGLISHPRVSFPGSDMVAITLSREGFARLVSQIDGGFARKPDGTVEEALGPGLYGPSLFYRGVDTFHIFNVCNHWVARLLSAAGLPTAPLLSALPQGLLLDLKWRSGLVLLPRD
jgi:uncharacterized protein (TIGR02117 family)